MTDLDLQAQKASSWLKGHEVRISFERIALILMVLVILVVCLIGFWSDAMADRVHKLTDDIVKLLGLLGITVGGSWGTSAVHKGIETFGGKNE